MSNNVFAHTREAVRIKVKKCEHNLPPDWRKFSVDPQITSLEVLYSLLAKAFDIKSDFSIKYKAFDPAGNEIYLAVLSDWDLDAAFHRINNISIQTSTEPCLMLQIDIKPFTEVKEWDPETSANALIGSNTSSSTGATPTGSSSARELMSPLQQSFGVSQKYVQQMQTKLPGLIMNQMEKTFSMVQKAFNLTEETMAALPPRPPLADNEFRMFLDALGQIQRSEELRKVIFLGGIDPSLRRVVWKHILNVYPAAMNGHQRMDYMRRKSEHYYRLRDTWKSAIKQGFVVGELSYITSMVKKDVLRTDRLHPFYAGSDDNQNIASLFNILTTYALNHPSVSYCQGMSDIASPLLVTMNDEAQAYICFCAIMARVRGNFMLDGIAMTQKFAHLTEALSYYDSDFWDYLKAQQADDLLFCYRWLLLELKREFPFEDSLRMLEVQWSSLNYETNVGKELKLYEKEFVPVIETAGSSTPSGISGPPISPSYLLVKPRENAYTKVCALRRQSSSVSLNSLSSSSLTSSINNRTEFLTTKIDGTKRLNQSLDDNITRHATRRRRRASSKAHQSLDETKMLQLLEGRVEIAEDLICSSNNKQDANEQIDDNNVFPDHSSQFIFHDTNPFKDDTPAAEMTFNTTIKQPVHKTVLSSSSSFIVGEGFYNISKVGNGDANSKEVENKSLLIPKGIGKLHNKNILSNYNAVSTIIAKQLTNNAVSEGVKRVSSSGGGHFKDLKEKIAATSRRGLLFDECNEKSQQHRLVKNFNEFLNFAAINKSRVGSVDLANSGSILGSDDAVQKKSGTQSPQKSSVCPTSHRLVQLTEEGLGSEASDLSSLPDITNNTWSASTAVTAIQQSNNFSSNSLHLELNSLPSLTHTPERTPTIVGRSGGITPTAIADSYEARQNDSSVMLEDSQEIDYQPMSTAITRELHLDAENLDRQVFGIFTAKNSTSSEIEYEKLGKDSLEIIEDLKENESVSFLNDSDLLIISQNDSTVQSKVILNERIDNNLNMNAHNVGIEDSTTLNPFLDESLHAKIKQQTPNSSTVGCYISTSSSSLPDVLVPISMAVPDTKAIDETGTTAAEEDVAFLKTTAQNRNITNTTPTLTPKLPPPSEFGGGNPFLMFLCLTLLLQHRNTIMKSNMDYNEIAMHFDKMVRKHDVTRVLNQARRMYIDYLKNHTTYSEGRQHKQQHHQLLFQEPQQQQTSIAISAQHSNDVNRNTTNAVSSQKRQQHSSNHSSVSSYMKS